MTALDARLYFDFVDPLSWLVERAVTALEASSGPRVARVGVELRPPPEPLTLATDAFWATRHATAGLVAPELRLARPPLVPWTRKAHELHAFACARDVGAAVRRAIFEAFLAEGRDIGRVDVLVQVAAGAGLDRTETKAALDVDRHLEDVLAARREAASAGVAELPALQVGGDLVQGFRNLTDLSTLLGGSPQGGR